MASKTMVSNLVKTVNIKANIPVRDVTPPVYGVREGIKMTASDILKCLCKRAIVDQVLSDGSTVRLTTKNFREDFEGQLQAKLAAEKEAIMSGENITGSLEGIDLLSEIDHDPDEGNHNEPEEAGNVVNEDGSIGIEPTHVDPEDGITGEPPVDETVQEHSETADIAEEETTTEAANEEPTEEAESDSAETEATTEQQSEVNTTDNTPDTSKVTRKNTSRNNSKKRRA